VTSLGRDVEKAKFEAGIEPQAEADVNAKTGPHFEERYSRQVLFRGIGSEGQRRLAAARVAIVGCGATGSALASLLARRGGDAKNHRSGLR
jgi:hypothetical protein